MRMELFCLLTSSLPMQILVQSLLISTNFLAMANEIGVDVDTLYFRFCDPQCGSSAKISLDLLTWIPTNCSRIIHVARLPSVDQTMISTNALHHCRSYYNEYSITTP